VARGEQWDVASDATENELLMHRLRELFMLARHDSATASTIFDFSHAFRGEYGMSLTAYRALRE
jgi:hypothetical protein